MKILDKTEDGNLDEQEKIKKTSQETEWELKPQYVIIALVVFVTFCCCILFFFMIYRYNGFTDFWKKLSLILQPIIIGVVIAYLLNPIMKFLEGHLLKFLEPRMKSKRKAKKTSRGIAITGSLVFLVGICVLLVAAIVPSISASIQSMITSFPQEAKDLTKWVDEVTNGDTELASMIQQGVDKITDTVETFFEDDIFSKVQTYLTSITSGVIYGLKFVLNVIVGLIISVYVMADQEHFAGQAKKIVYAMFKPVRANVIVDTVRKSNEIFSGFIIGKILDSADTVLVAVLIGVTNVIPFFGPFIGAVPSFIIIVLQNPIQGLYFLIFIVVLQQIDGNIIGPKILGSSTGLSAFWVVFAILVFGGLWGFPGMLLGVPLMAVIYYVAQKTVSYFLKKRGLTTDTLAYVYLTKVDKESNQPVYDKNPSKKELKKHHGKHIEESIEESKKEE